MSTTTVTIRHNFETAHRLPHLGGKCENLHGHSWWAECEFVGAQDSAGVIVDFALLKRHLREWIDLWWDHGTILGPDDPLLEVLRGAESKVYDLGVAPTVENIAAALADICTTVVVPPLDRGNGLAILRVTIEETHLNRATWWLT